MIIDQKTKCIKIEIVKGKSKNTGNAYEAVKISIGNDEYPVSFFCFCKGFRDLAYVKQVLDYVAKNQ